MGTKFIISGSNIHVVNMHSGSALDKLPPKIYSIKQDVFGGYFLSVEKDSLQLPSKIYGSTEQRVSKCVETYKERSTSTGILMTGDKGTGKTLFMALLANTAITSLGLPVILIKEAYEGSNFMTFIESLGECCLLFDEVGKMYKTHPEEHESGQDSLLSLMDGVDKTKRLIVMTENSEFDISTFMLNRPSRIYYHFKYNKLDEDSITEYCKSKSVITTIEKEIIELSRMSRIFSFDMLQAIVEEYLRFEEPLDDIIKDLNIDISKEDVENIEIVKITHDADGTDKEIDGISVIPRPTQSWGEIYIKIKGKSKSRDHVYFQDENLVYESGNNLVYKRDGFTVVAKVLSKPTNNYANLAF